MSEWPFTAAVGANGCSPLENVVFNFHVFYKRRKKERRPKQGSQDALFLEDVFLCPPPRLRAEEGVEGDALRFINFFSHPTQNSAFYSRMERHFGHCGLSNRLLSEA